MASSISPNRSILWGRYTGVLIGQHFILSGVEHSRFQLAAMSEAARHAYYVSESAAVKAPYLTIGAVVVLWAALIAFTRLPTVVQDGGDRRSFRSHASGLVRNSNFRFAVVAQFFYVGAQVGIWSFFIRYAQRALPGLPEKNAANFLTLSLVMFMLGRFIGTAMMRYLSPNRLLAAFAIINMLLGAIAVGYPGRAGVGALIAMSFFMSIMFPTIFALGLRGLADDDRKLLLFVSGHGYYRWRDLDCRNGGRFRSRWHRHRHGCADSEFCSRAGVFPFIPNVRRPCME